MTEKMTREKALAMTPEQRGRMLVAALRSLPRKAMPQGFVKVEGDGHFRWRFDTVSETEQLPPEGRLECGTNGCAIGLAIALNLIDRVDDNSLGAAEAFGIDANKSYDLFFEPRTYGFHRYEKADPYSRVTPQAVAKKLEQVLDETYGKPTP